MGSSGDGYQPPQHVSVGRATADLLREVRLQNLQQILDDLNLAYRANPSEEMIRVGDHGYRLKPEAFKRYSALQRFYDENSELLSDKLYFWRTEKMNNWFAPHCDIPPEMEKFVSVNFGLINCDERSPTIFYFIDNPKMRVENRTQFLVNYEQATQVEKPILSNQSYIFNSGAWHGVTNPTGKERVVVSWWGRPGTTMDSMYQGLSSALLRPKG